MDSKHGPNSNNNTTVTPPEVVVLESDDEKTGGGSSPAASSCFSPSTSSTVVHRPVPAFLLKIYDMLENIETSSNISWRRDGASFVITNPHRFASDVLPMYFRHNNFQSFITQLNTYGFRKIRWEHWEYSNQYFRKGGRHLLKYIQRRNSCNQISFPPKHQSGSTEDAPPSSSSSSCTGADDMEKEVEIVTNANRRMKMEIARLKDKHEEMKQKLDSLKNRAAVGIDEKGGTRGVVAAVIMAEGVLKKREFEEKSITDNNNNNNSNNNNNNNDDNNSLANNMEFVHERFTSEPGNETGTLITLEDMVGEPSDWDEYYRNFIEPVISNHRNQI